MEIICLRIQGATPSPTFEGLRSVNIVARDSSGGIPAFHPPETTWRIIPVSKWLVTRTYKPFRPFWPGVPQPYLEDLQSHAYLTTYKSWDVFLLTCTSELWVPGLLDLALQATSLWKGLMQKNHSTFNLVPFHPTGTFAPARQLVWLWWMLLFFS